MPDVPLSKGWYWELVSVVNSAGSFPDGWYWTGALVVGPMEM